MINCAGITRDNFVSKMSDDEFDTVIDVNLKGTFYVIQVHGFEKIQQVVLQRLKSWIFILLFIIRKDVE